MLQSDVAAWGREIATKAVDGYTCRVYARRRHNVAELLLDGRRWADRDYLVFGERRLNFADHEAAVAAMVRYLRDRAIGPGDRVLLLGANTPAWIITFWSTIAAGAVAVLGNAWWSDVEAAATIANCEPALIVGDGKRLAKISHAGPVVDYDEIDRIMTGAFSGHIEPPPQDVEDEAAAIVYTSGTTGSPKGAVLSHRAIIHNVHNLLSSAGRLPQEISVDGLGHPTLMTNPLFHLSGLQPVLWTLVTGGTVVMLPGRFDPPEVMAVIERERIRTWGTVPTLVSRLLDHPDFHSYDLSSLRTVSMGGAMVPTALAERVSVELPTTRRGVSTVYGLTESGGGVTTARGNELLDRPGTVGRPFAVVEVRIDKPDADGLGEILVRTPTAMSGYWGHRGEVVDEDGWIHSGDLGRIDGDGYVYVLDRLKDLVIRGGENVASAHVEGWLIQHPDVAEVAVLGLPHADLGEEVAAVVVPRDGAELTVTSLHEHAVRRLAYFEVPTRWWILHDPLPTSVVGKVLKRSLRDKWPPIGGDADHA